jgi:hypothetical protein
MIGSMALVLPTLAFDAGYVGTGIAIVIAGCSCAFSSWLYSLHLADFQPDVGDTLNNHFRVSFCAKFVYDFFVWLFIIFLCI